MGLLINNITNKVKVKKFHMIQIKGSRVRPKSIQESNTKLNI